MGQDAVMRARACGNVSFNAPPAPSPEPMYDYRHNTKVLSSGGYEKKGVLEISTIVLCFLRLIGFIFYLDLR